MPDKILVFAAHPDDDVIGCGGSLAKHIEKGNKVSVCYMTSGEAGSLDYDKKELAAIREEEAKKASRILGIEKLFFLRSPDGYLEATKSNLIKLTSLIRSEKPNTVYVHHAADGHRDHKATYQLVVEAIGRAGVKCFQECGKEPWPTGNVLSYEVWTPLAQFNYVEDISNFIQKKIDALLAHESQIKNVRYDDAAKALARYRGVMTGNGEYCEVFQDEKISKLF